LKKIDIRDRGTLTLIALGVPVLVALVVLFWGFSRTDSHIAIPDPSAAPIIAVDQRGNPVPIPPTQPPATATPTLGPGTAYRIEGVVVDDLGAPIPNVCIAIGPNGCQDHSPRTDARGVYFIDFPAADVDYDLHFTKDGYQEIRQRLKPTKSQVLNLVLGR
jgi:hypothetical protein